MDKWGEMETNNKMYSRDS